VQQHQVAQTPASRFPGAGEFRGENPPYGAPVTFSLNQEGLPHPDDETERARKAAERRARLEATAEEAAGGGLGTGEGAGRPEESMAEAAEASAEAEEAEAAAEDERPGRAKKPMAEIEIADASGAVVRTFEQPVTLGVNRAVWDLRRDAFRRPPTDEEESPWQRGGSEVPPGTYTVTVRYGGEEAAGELRVLPEPRSDAPAADRQAAYEAKDRAVLETGRLQERLSRAIERVMATRQDLARIRAMAQAEQAEWKKAGGEGDEPHAELLKAAGKLGKGLDELEKALWTPEDVKGIVAEEDAWSKVTYARRALGSSWDPPTPAQLRYLEVARQATEEATARAERYFAEEVGGFKATVEGAGLGLFTGSPPSP
jgi:hypothetical protein